MKILKRKILDSLSRHRILVSNFGYLSVLQIATFLIPLITLPYLLAVLGKDIYGLVVFAQAVVSYFLILVEFGFGLSATKDISIYRDNKAKISEIVSSVYLLKGIFVIITLLILFCVLKFVPQANEYKMLFLLSMHVCFYEWLFPKWYFQGVERMKYITIIVLISRLLFLCLILIFVKSADDYLLVPIINGLGALVSGVVAIYVLLVKDKVKFQWPSRVIIKKYFMDAVPFFLGSVAGKVKIISNKTIIGVFIGMDTVAIYDVADKIKQVFITFLEIVANVIFPSISKTKNSQMLRKIIRLEFLLSVFVYLSVGFCLTLIVPRFFSSYQSVVNLYWILGLLIVFQPLSFIIGTGALVVNNLTKVYTLNLYMATGVYLLSLAFIHVTNTMTINTIALSLLISVFFELIHRIYLCHRFKILHWIV